MSPVDSTLSRAEVVAKLRAGELVYTDLVLENGTWCSLIDSVEFFKEARPSAWRERWAQRAAGCVGGVVSLAGMLVVSSVIRLIIEVPLALATR